MDDGGPGGYYNAPHTETSKGSWVSILAGVAMIVVGAASGLDAIAEIGSGVLGLAIFFKFLLPPW